MGFLNFLRNLGSGGNVVKGTLEGVGTLARDMRSAITGDIDPARLADLQERAQELENSAMLAQAEINKAEAQTGSLFIAGWRPFIGWIGGLALFYNFIARPLLVGFGVADMPDIDSAALWPIITAMLGLGAYRTYEKHDKTQHLH